VEESAHDGELEERVECHVIICARAQVGLCGATRRDLVGGGMRHAAGGSEGEGTGAREVGSRASERLELCVEWQAWLFRLFRDREATLAACSIWLQALPWAETVFIWLQRYAKRFAKACATRTPSP